MSCSKKCPYTDKYCIHSLPICKAYEKEYKPLTAIRCKIEVSNEEKKIHQTNADRIRQMSDEELEKFISKVNRTCIVNALGGDTQCDYEDVNCTECKAKFCGIQKWLQSEAE